MEVATNCDDPGYQLRYFDKISRSTHAELAAAAGLHYALRNGISPPDWCLRRADELLRQLLVKKPTNARGRASGPVARYRQAIIDWERWNKVEIIRLRQLDAPREIKDIRRELARSSKDKSTNEKHRSLLEAALSTRQKFVKWHGKSWLRAYQAAADVLASTPYRGGPEAIKKSYSRVKRHPNQYSLFEDDFLSDVGFGDLVDAPSPAMPLCDLPPYENLVKRTRTANRKKARVR